MRTSTSPVALSASSSLTSFMTSCTASPGPFSRRALAPVTGVMLTRRSLASVPLLAMALLTDSATVSATVLRRSTVWSTDEPPGSETSTEWMTDWTRSKRAGGALTRSDRSSRAGVTTSRWALSVRAISRAKS